MTKGQRGRRIARLMLTLAVGFGVLPVFLFVATPGFMGGPWGFPLWHYAVPALGVVGIVVGLVWMIRIYRAVFEPDVHPWRYRAKGRY